LAVDKPADIATQPDLEELGKAWVKKKFNKPGNVFLEPIHRLDKPVAGIVLFARTSKALSRLQEQMRERAMEKNLFGLGRRSAKR
jgi:23S rRNA pseudouridine1911/1915/1917 synthase